MCQPFGEFSQWGPEQWGAYLSFSFGRASGPCRFDCDKQNRRIGALVAMAMQSRANIPAARARKATEAKAVMGELL